LPSDSPLPTIADRALANKPFEGRPSIGDRWSRPSSCSWPPRYREKQISAFFSLKSPKLHVCKRLMLPSPSSHPAATPMLSAVRTNFALELG
jgi:hypothetical protein